MTNILTNTHGPSFLKWNMHLNNQDVCATGSGVLHKFTHFCACLGFYNPVVVACPMHMRTLVILAEAPCCQSRPVDVVKTAPWFKIIKDSNPWHPFFWITWNLIIREFFASETRNTETSPVSVAGHRGG